MRRFLFMILLVATPFTASLVTAEIQPGSREFGIHAGVFFGDNLTDQSFLGSRPELDDAFIFGVNYLYFPTSAFGLSPRYTFVPSEVKNTPGRGVDMNVHLLDLNLHWNANPQGLWNYYLITGLGWAVGDLENDITIGATAGVPTRISDDNGFTYNVGLGAEHGDDAENHAPFRRTLPLHRPPGRSNRSVVEHLGGDGRPRVSFLMRIRIVV